MTASDLHQVAQDAREEQSVMSRDGTRIAFERIGSGPAVILVGGATMTRLRIVGYLVRKFERCRRWADEVRQRIVEVKTLEQMGHEVPRETWDVVVPTIVELASND